MIRTQKQRLRDDLKALGDRLASNDAADANRLVEDETNRQVSASSIVSTRVTQGRTRALVALGATAAIGLLVAVLVFDQSSEEPPPDASQSLTDAEVVACSDGIGFGVITKVEDAKLAYEVRLSLAMEEWLKPSANAGKSISFVTASAAETGDPPFRIGERVLFVLQEAVSNHQVFRELPDPTDSVSAQAMGKEIREILRGNSDTSCPSFWGR